MDRGGVSGQGAHTSISSGEMKRFSGVFAVLATVAVAGSAAAQSAPGARETRAPAAAAQEGGEIRGVVRDAANGEPLSGASVAIRRQRDSTLVTGAVTRADGSFRVQGVPAGAYYLRVARLGYTTATVRGVAVSGTGVADAGTVRLSGAALALQGITATTQRQTVSTSPDRTVVSTAAMPTVTGGTATDVLRNVPGVDVDADGQVSLRGNTAVAIQINGRPTPLTGDALTNFIKQLPANLVDRVEVVPNPSAKNDPDGMGGIINLVLKQNTGLGTSGGFSLTGGSGGRYGGSGNLGTQRGPLTLFGSYGVNRDRRGSFATDLRDQRDGGGTETLQEQLTRGEWTSLSHTANGSGELKLGPRDVLSSNVMLNHRASDNRSSNGFTVMDAARTPTGSYSQHTGAAEAGLTTDYALGFRHTVQPHRNELSTEVRFNRQRENNVSDFTSAAGSMPPPATFGDVRNARDGVTRELDGQADYTRELGAGTLLETGYKGTFRRLDSDYAVDSLRGGAPVPALDDRFRYDERVHAGYVLLTRQAGEKLTLQGGVRVERASTTFRRADDGRSYPNAYTTLFPSAAATWQPTESDQLHLSYSRRIERPEAERLDPFPFVQDPFHVVVGNPQLKPEYEHAYELTYQRSTPFGSLSVTPFYRHTVSDIKRFHLIGAGGVDTMTFRNLDSSDQLGSELHAQLRAGGRVSGFAGVTAFRLHSNGSNVQQGLSASGFAWTARANLTVKLDPRTDLQWFQFYRGARNTEQGRQGGSGMANVAMRRKLTDKATLNLRVSDPFHTMRSSSLLDAPNYTETQTRRFDSRAVYLSFSYTFGHPPRLRQPEPDQPQTPPDPNGA
jgi:outer membrane receptor protein involved in Fe transport